MFNLSFSLVSKKLQTLDFEQKSNNYEGKKLQIRSLLTVRRKVKSLFLQHFKGMCPTILQKSGYAP